MVICFDHETYLKFLEEFKCQISAIENYYCESEASNSLSYNKDPSRVSRDQHTLKISILNKLSGRKVFTLDVDFALPAWIISCISNYEILDHRDYLIDPI